MSIDLITDENYKAFLPYIPNEYVIKLSLPETIAVGMSYVGVAMGVILGSVNSDVLYLDWLFVGEEFRNRGIATSLIETLIVHSWKNVQCIRGEFDPDNSDLRRLFRSCGFGISYEEHPIYSATLGDLRDHFIFKSFRPDKGSMQLCDVPRDILKDFSAEMERISAPMETPFNIADYNGSLSYMYIQNHMVCGCLLVQNLGEGLH
ncbi:MAG: GNAT family N-acetyltransferase, partial [Oscillospiraceae bacterium]